MSGIYGVVGCDGAPVTDESLAPIAAVMSFWGPDGHGQWRGDSAGLGNLTLRVTPESLQERQPASIQAVPHLVITADARIDNRGDLFDALDVPVRGRDQTPDSSLILLAYERWGADCVTRLLGDFSLAIWNTRERTLFCARDPFGCRPFVYRFDGKRFIFASDVRGVLAGAGSRRLNEPLLAAHLQMRTYHAEKELTFFEDVVKLLPAHWLTLSGTNLRISRYWSPEDAAEVRCANAASYAEQMQTLVRQSVECRLRSAFPVGAHLSGGLDSSAISILASRALRDRRQELALFSWSPPPDRGSSTSRDDEYSRINAVCGQENLVCRYVPATRASYFDVFKRDFTVEPTALMIHETNVQALAGNAGLRVMLSGWGGDEAASVNAVNYLAEYLLKRQWSSLSEAARFHLASGRQNLLGRGRKFGGILRSLIVPGLPDSLYALTARNTFLAYRPSCIQPGFARLHKDKVSELRGPAWRKIPGIREQIRYRLEFGYIPLRLEHWAGSGARHRLEYRYPMLDKRLVEFVLGVPTAELGAPNQNRSLFRRAMEGVLPQSGGWAAAKLESAGLPAYKEENFRTHSEWARHVIFERPASPAMRIVDPARILAAVRVYSASGRLADLAGVRAALGCYAIDALE